MAEDVRAEWEAKSKQESDRYNEEMKVYKASKQPASERTTQNDEDGHASHTPSGPSLLSSFDKANARLLSPTSAGGPSDEYITTEPTEVISLDD